VASLQRWRASCFPHKMEAKPGAWSSPASRELNVETYCVLGSTVFRYTYLLSAWADAMRTGSGAGRASADRDGTREPLRAGTQRALFRGGTRSRKSAVKLN